MAVALNGVSPDCNEFVSKEPKKRDKGSHDYTKPDRD